MTQFLFAISEILNFVGDNWILAVSVFVGTSIVNLGFLFMFNSRTVRKILDPIESKITDMRLRPVTDKLVETGIVGKLNPVNKIPFVGQTILPEEVDSIIQSHVKKIGETLNEKKSVVIDGIELPDRDFFKTLTKAELDYAEGFKMYFRKMLPTIVHFRKFVKKARENNAVPEYEIYIDYTDTKSDLATPLGFASKNEYILKSVSASSFRLLNFYLYLEIQNLKKCKASRRRRILYLNTLIREQ